MDDQANRYPGSSGPRQSGRPGLFNSGPTRKDPVFNLPPVIVGLCAVLIGVHLARTLFLPVVLDNQVLLYFAFWPFRYEPNLLFSGQLPGGLAADLWSFLTYGFLHGGTMHLVFNLLWMAIFGSAVARRFGSGRFLLFSALCTIAGAGVHLLTHFGEATPMVGASAAISGHMAAAIRFVFQLGGPLGAIRLQNDTAYFVPAVSLRDAFSDRQVLIFMAVWFGLNIAFGMGSLALGGEAGSVAWQAHIGGFLAGLLIFPLFDPVPARRKLS